MRTEERWFLLLPYFVEVNLMQCSYHGCAIITYERATHPHLPSVRGHSKVGILIGSR